MRAFALGIIIAGLIALPASAQQTLPRPGQTPAQKGTAPPQGQKGAPQQAQQPPVAPPAPPAVGPTSADFPTP